MSVPERFLDPPDDQLCEEHGRLLPCRMCRDEREMERWELEREDAD